MNSLSRRRFLALSAATSTFFALRERSLALDDSKALPNEKDLVVRQANPLNAEPALAALVEDDITRTKHFYVRNHGEVPKVETDGFKLRLEGLVRKPLEISIAELRDRFKASEWAATLTCAGNRRAEMSRIKPVGGVAWEAGAVGHGKFAGLKLAEVLKMAELETAAKHVWFEGLDSVPIPGGMTRFGGSIPLAAAMQDELPVLLAHTMNGDRLTPEHGFPLRAVVPGFIGARSVKWLAKITVADKPSPNHFVADSYKLIQSESKAELAAADPIYEFSVNSAICVPAPGAKLSPERTTIRGYALPGGKATVEKVEVSTDGGKNWQPARLDDDLGIGNWRLWSCAMDLRKGKHKLAVRATDSAGRTQPEEGKWNLKGYLYNGWHRVDVEVV